MVCLDIPVSLVAKSDLGKYNMSPKVRLARLKKALEDVPLPTTAIIGRQETSLRSVLTTSPGDIIPLNAVMDAELYICGKFFHKGKVQMDNNQLQLRIADFPEQEDTGTGTETTADTPADSTSTSEPPRTGRRRGRSRQQEGAAASSAAQTRPERREARLSGRRKTRTQGDT